MGKELFDKIPSKVIDLAACESKSGAPL